jgi:hypothetical protein
MVVNGLLSIVRRCDNLRGDRRHRKLAVVGREEAQFLACVRSNFNAADAYSQVDRRLLQ